MPGPCRQLAKAEGAQFAAQRLLADRNAEFLEHPLRQVDQPPAHDAMNRCDRAALDDLPQRIPALVVEQRRIARRLAVDQAGRSLGIERQHPVPHRLQPDTTDLGGLGARAAGIDRPQRKYPPSLSSISRPLGQLPQSRRSCPWWWCRSAGWLQVSGWVWPAVRRP